MRAFTLRLQSLNPVWLTFFVSLALSAIAGQFEVTIAKDTAFYFDVARTFNEDGLRAAFGRFNWPWMPALFGVTQTLTGLSWEVIGRLWTALFMATGCALMVSLMARRVPQAVWWAMLVVLAMPAFNQFRGDILREHGTWCFSVLAMWLAFEWEARGGWARALAMQAAVLGAALFRLEAIALMPALVLWRVVLVRQPDGVLRLVQAALLPVLVASGGLLAMLMLDAVLMSRVNGYFFYFLNPYRLFANFTRLSEQFGGLLRKWSVDDAGKIIFFGMFATVVWTFIRLLGPFAVPFLFRDGWRAWREYWQRFTPMALALVLYFGVMLVFFIQSLFINSRYSALMNVMAVPLAVLAMMNVARRFPRAVKVLVAACVVVMLVNVISLSAKKTHYVAAGQWLAQHVERTDNIYFDDYRMSWYAGWGFMQSPMTREEALSDARAATLHYFALEAKPDEQWLIEWLARYPERRVLAQFANRKGATVVIIGTCVDTPTAPVCQTP